MSKYNEALALVPGDGVANSGIKNAEKLLAKECYKILGDWKYLLGKINIKPDGTIKLIGKELGGTWECLDPKASTFFISFNCTLCDEWNAVLKEDGQCLTSIIGGCWRRPNYKREDQSKESQISL